MNRRSRRDSETLALSRNQRATANKSARRMWQMLRNRRCRKRKFRREYPIPPNTADFCCLALKLTIEVDGEPHPTDEGRQHDQRRDQHLAERGNQVVWIPGYEVFRNAAAVRRVVEQAEEDSSEQGDTKIEFVSETGTLIIRGKKSDVERVKDRIEKIKAAEQDQP